MKNDNLDEGYYYVQIDDEGYTYVDIDYYRVINFGTIKSWEKYDGKIINVLGKVPSYEQLYKMENGMIDIMNPNNVEICQNNDKNNEDKIFLNTLTMEEIIKRLQNGEVIRSIDNNSESKLVNNILCTHTDNYNIINDSLIYFQDTKLYFKATKPLDLNPGITYKTRNGKKAYII